MAGCGKIFGVCCSTGHSTDHRHISHNHDQIAHDHQNPKSEVPANKVSGKRQNHVAKPLGNKQEGRKSELETNDRFSDYIKRAKLKIRSVTTLRRWNTSASNFKVDDVHDEKSEDHLNKTFSDYIKRVKIRIRKSTSIGNRKSFQHTE